MSAGFVDSQSTQAGAWAVTFKRMMIAQIAVLTAFLIVELSARFFDRGYALWPLYLGPGVVLSPLLILFVRRIENIKPSAKQL